VAGQARRRIIKKSLVFTCDECGELWIRDTVHGEVAPAACLDCSGDLLLIATGLGNWVGDAAWYRCRGCNSVFMKARGEFTHDVDRDGFLEHGHF